ncbi:MAG TPA: TIGR02302 family protein [Pseudolabrys sp.]|nr:TIGR02302 family protein [Pseudolabrys sp.]
MAHDDFTPDREVPIRVLLARAVQRARGSLFWERLWPALATFAVAAGLFLILSWAGLWLVLPPLGRVIGLAVFGLLMIAAVIPLLRLRMPSIHDGLRRLDRVSGAPHRPATTVVDRIAANDHDPVAQALWQAHVERALMSARQLKAGWPSPRLALRDPMALRALVLILVVATFFGASGEHFKRIAAAFDWQGVVAPANFRIDAWVNPPAYTGRPPVMLAGMRPGQAAETQQDAPIAVPVGSQLVVRSTGDVHFDIERKGGVDLPKADAKKADTESPLPKGSEERRFVIKSDGAAVLHGAGSDLTWAFTAIPDRPPTITLLKEPERQLRGALRLDYKMTDDYGVVGADAVFKLKDAKDKEANGKPTHPLFGPPEFKLSLPQARTRSGAAQTTHDLTAHPWAGADVSVQLVARDEAGNKGHSKTVDFTLPERFFSKPIARALIEQRRILALDANEKPVVLTALDALTIAPEKFTPDASVYLGLRSIYYDLKHARTDPQLREVVARMWDMAVQLEDGNVGQAEQALRQAQEALRQALDRGASDEELKKLMDDLRAAMNKFMQALAEQMRKNPQLSRPLDRNARNLSPQDLNRMLDRMEQLARSGQRDAARRMLDQMQSMLENLQMARPGQSDQGQDEMDQALNELGDMIRKQQQLRDRTFQQGQNSRRGQQQFGNLQRDQQALRQRLNKLLEQLRKNGLGNMQQQGQQQGQQGKGQQGQQGQMGQLGQAGKEMGQAQGQLGQGDAESAVGSQGRALEALRKGAQGLAQSMQQNGYGQGQGQPGARGRARAEQDTDPLGRPLRGREYTDDSSVKVPGEIDAQRARRILQELRKRYGESYRPQMELDYIERLLKGN